MTTAQAIKLTGQSLVDYVNDHSGNISRAELVINSGYVRADGRPAYTEFYTELLKAKEIITPGYIHQDDVEDAAYEDLDPDIQKLYDNVHEAIGEKWDHEQILDFISELDDIGIVTPDQFEESFEHVLDDTWKAESEFAEFYVTELGCESIPEIILHAIDWQAVWDHQLRYDYNTIEFDGSTYFFRNL